MRGIVNTTGTACHLNAALMVWHHCLGLLGDPDAVFLLLQAADSEENGHHQQDEEETCRENHNLRCLQTSLRRIFRELDAAASSSENVAAVAVDPLDLYDQLRLYSTSRSRSTHSQLDAQNLGDAVTALDRLLQLVLTTTTTTTTRTTSSISNNNNNNKSGNHPLYDKLLHTGRIQSVLTGTKIGYKSRTKRLKERPLANPFPLRLMAAANPIVITDTATTTTTNLDLHTALRRALWQEESVQDYSSWPETRISDCSTVGHWNTTRRQYVRQFPPIWMLHLQRFGVVTGGNDTSTTTSHDTTSSGSTALDTTTTTTTTRRRQQLQAVDGQQCWQIPATLDLRPYLAGVEDEDLASPPPQATTTIFHLRGGILHVSEPTIDQHHGDNNTNDDDDLAESGHYVSVIRQNNQWFLVDDDRVHANLPLDRVLRWLGGDWYHPPPPPPENSGDDTPNDHQPGNNGVEEAGCRDSVEVGRHHAIMDDDDDDDDRGVNAASYLRGVLLIYHRDDLSEITKPWMENVQALCETHNDDAAAAAAATVDNASINPELWMGRRLRVRWNNGTYYSGTVTAYNPDTGKHTVTYDDGDVRHYRLAKKTIEWLVDSPHADQEENKDNNNRLVATTGDPAAHGWVGRRLRVQWKGGAYYTGLVTAFDPDTGNHTVTYDDGDVREYRLSQKTFEWIVTDGGCANDDDDHGGGGGNNNNNKHE